MRSIYTACVMWVSATVCGLADSKIIELPSLPHILMHRELAYVDVLAELCDAKEFLELIACTQHTKEHESVVAIKAQPKHVHLALLLVGAKAGKPAHRVAINEEKTRWRDVPATGTRLMVFIIYEDANGVRMEVPLPSLLVNRTGESYPNSPFVFTGSRLLESVAKGKPSLYSADRSGNVLSLVNFGDEMIAPVRNASKVNSSLMWKLRPEAIPDGIDSVWLRLKVVSEISQK